MGLKSYIIATVLFIILLFGFVHSLELGDYTFSKFDISYTLPISVWFVLPIVFLAVVTYIHIIFYGIVNYFKIRLLDGDLDTTLELIKSKLLEKENKIGFRTKKFKELSSILNQLDISVKKESFTSSNEDLNKVVSAIQDLNNGIYVSEKSLKVDEKSSLAKKNLINKIESQVDFAVDVVKKAEKYDEDIVNKAFLKALNEKSMTTIKKIYKNVNLNKELVFKLLEKNKNNEEFGFSNDEILDITKSVKLTKDDFINLAQNYQNSLNPDSLIELFEKLSAQNDDATTAYLYILDKFEMNDKLREVLSNSSVDEYVSFRALLDLKDAGKHYDLEKLSYKL